MKIKFIKIMLRYFLVVPQMIYRLKLTAFKFQCLSFFDLAAEDIFKLRIDTNNQNMRIKFKYSNKITNNISGRFLLKLPVIKHISQLINSKSIKLISIKKSQYSNKITK